MYIVYFSTFPFTAFPFLSSATGSSLAAVLTVKRERERDSGDGWLLTRSWIQSGLEEGGLRWRERENNKELLLILHICLSAQKLSDAAYYNAKNASAPADKPPLPKPRPAPYSTPYRLG